MQHPGGVRGVQRRTDLAHDRHRPRRGQRPVTLQHGGQVLAVDQAHVHVELTVDLAEVVNRYDVRFLQPPRGAGLALHPRAEHRIVGQRLRHQLQRHDPVPHRVLGLVDVAHAAATHQPPQPVGPELRALPRTRGRVTHRPTPHPADCAPQTDCKRPRVVGHCRAEQYPVACQA